MVPHSLNGLACNGPESLPRGERPCYQGPGGLLYVGVDQPVVELVGCGELLLCGPQPPSDGGFVLGTPSHEALGQNVP